MSDAWQKVVRERAGLEAFAMYKDAGTKLLDTIPFGRTEDGNLIDESVNTEWEINFQGAAALFTLPSFLYASDCICKRMHSKVGCRCLRLSSAYIFN
eukprot:6214305-Pleurochrysis_carterae.AAC.2